jgi:SagB-type dehydrogenase family enzyme
MGKMRCKVWLVLPQLLVLVILSFMTAGCGIEKAASAVPEGNQIVLPEPAHDSGISIEEALLNRRSVRSFGNEAITLQQLGQLLWAGQGITSADGKRTAPSAGALYPLKVYAVIGNVAGITPGIYEYQPALHTMTRVIDGDWRQALSQAAMGQSSVKQAALDIVITGVYEITTSKYGERGKMYVHMEAGHAAQNICLQAVSLKLGAVTIGGYDDAGVRKVLNLPEHETPLYIIPAGNATD